MCLLPLLHIGYKKQPNITKNLQIYSYQHICRFYPLSCIMNCNRPYEIFAMSSPNYVTKRKYSVTLDFDVYEDFNPYEIDWNKIFQIEGQEHLDVNIRNLDVESDINW